MISAMNFLGDSITATSHDTGPNFVQILEADDSFGWQSVTNFGVGGDFANDQMNEALTIQPTETTGTCVYLGANNFLTDEDNSADRLNNYVAALLSVVLQVAIKQSLKVTAQEMDQLAGAWTSIDSSIATGGMFSTQNGSVLEATVSGRHIVHVGLWNNTKAGKFRVAVDGKLQGPEFNACPFGNLAPSEDIPYGPFALAFTDYSNGPHDVRIGVTSATGADKDVYPVFTAGLSGDDTEPQPLVVLCNMYNLSAAGCSTYTVPVGAIDLYNRAIEQVYGFCKNKLGLNVVLADLYSVIDPSVHLYSDNLHPNNAGHEVIAAEVKRAYLTSGQPSSAGLRTAGALQTAITSRGHPIRTGKTLAFTDFGLQLV